MTEDEIQEQAAHTVNDSVEGTRPVPRSAAAALDNEHDLERGEGPV